MLYLSSGVLLVGNSENHSYNLHAPICGKNAKESKKVIRRMDKARKSSKDSYNIK